jgi:hypothetical protein
MRVLEYITLIWQSHRNSGSAASKIGEKLPLVIPVVLYPGPGKWTSTRRLRDLIEIPEKLRGWAETFAPDAGFCIVELSGLPLEKLADGQSARAVLAALQHQRTGKLGFDDVRAIIDELFSDPKREVAHQIAAHLWHYVMEHSELQPEQVDAIVHQVVPDTEKLSFMSTAEILRNAGLEQGMEQGRLITQRADVIDALEIRFNSVPQGLRDVVESITDSTRLRELLRAAICCVDLEAFASKL